MVITANLKIYGFIEKQATVYVRTKMPLIK